MPTYRITGPDGATYNVTAPEGASEQDVLAYVQANAGKSSEPAQPKPGLWETITGSLKESAGRDLQRAKDAAGFVRNLVTAPGEAAKAIEIPMATALPLALPGGGTVLTRLGATAAGAMLDDPKATAGENLATAGAATVAPAIAEGALGLGGKILRSLPGAKARVAQDDSTRLMETVGDLVPPVAKPRTPLDPTRPAWEQTIARRTPTTADELSELASGPGREAVGEAKESAVQFIERLTGHRPIRVPALSDQPLTVRQANDLLSEIGERAKFKNPLDRTWNGRDARRLYGVVARQIRDGIAVGEAAFRQGAREAGETFVGRGTRRALPPASGETVQPSSGPYAARPLSQRESVERTLEAGSFEGQPYREMAGNVVASVPGEAATIAAIRAPNRELIAQPRVSGTLRTGDESVAAAAWDKAQQAYSRWGAIEKLLQRPSTYSVFSDRAFLNTPDLQQRLIQPRVRATLRNKLDPEGYDALLESVRLQPGQLRRDELAWGAGRATDAGRMLSEMRGGTPAFVGAIPKTFGPNLASRYTRRPYTAPDSLRAILDAALANR